VACLSAAVHGWGRQPEDAPWFAFLDPALHWIVLLCFVFAASHTLRSPQRLALLIVALSCALVVIALQVVFDRMDSGFVYNRMGSESLPSVAQWGGLHQTGLLLLLGLTLTASGVVLNPSAIQAAASLVMCGMFLAVAYVNGSRSAILVMSVATTWMFLSAAVSGRRGWATSLTVGAVIAGVVMLVIGIFAGKGSLPVVTTLTGDRSPIWYAAAKMAIDHPLLGVGPGNYSEAMESGYAASYLPWYPTLRSGMDQAHNAVLHEAAEIGIAGAGLMVAFWWWLLAACRRAWQRGPVPLIACTLMVTLGALFLRLMFDSLFAGVATADRTRVLGGLLFAAAIAVDRLGRERQGPA
jgi:O-antigen ligase